jgi:hypothetical protein
MTATPMAGGSVLVEDERLGKSRVFTNADGRRTPPAWIGLRSFLDSLSGNWVESLIERSG